MTSQRVISTSAACSLLLGIACASEREQSAAPSERDKDQQMEQLAIRYEEEGRSRQMFRAACENSIASPSECFQVANDYWPEPEEEPLHLTKEEMKKSATSRRNPRTTQAQPTSSAEPIPLATMPLHRQPARPRLQPS